MEASTDRKDIKRKGHMHFCLRRMEMQMRMSMDDALTSATGSLMGRHRIWPQGSGRAEAVLHQHFKIDHALLIQVGPRNICSTAVPFSGCSISETDAENQSGVRDPVISTSFARLAVPFPYSCTASESFTHSPCLSQAAGRLCQTPRLGGPYDVLGGH